MGACYWCHWGWPKPIREIYEDCLAKLGGNRNPLHFGPAHLVWEDENWDLAQWCLDHFDEFKFDLTECELVIVRESLVRLIAVPDEFKNEPEGFDEDKNPQDFPPPKHWECEGSRQVQLSRPETYVSRALKKDNELLRLNDENSKLRMRLARARKLIEELPWYDVERNAWLAEDDGVKACAD